MKHITLHNFLKQQHLLQQRLKPTAVLWSWPVPRPTPEDVADDADGASWPPRSYTCAFCHREFRSAQALGGHMNVHRRDRAKLRGQYGATAPAAEASAPAPLATTEYAVLYPVLNSNAAGARAVFIPSGNVLLSTPDIALDGSAAHGQQCHIGCDDENEKDIDLELRLGWP
ncbi:hypothetical protein QYE76_045946 [Lolium multiflorum]|uniref:C2H2-type domain-containing protein n=1 Tax=Lolium multiflorum TaxID=4521 RepID=A0AAD8X0M7_LOLMU|nr:hypothetical protein QYE76_045946 [Lolium multiflorum]